MTISAESAKQRTTINIAGNLDESAAAKLNQLHIPSDCEYIVVNWDKLGSISSVGAATWVKFKKSLAARATLEYINCPVELVHIMNMLYNMGEDVKVSSLYFPYVCDTCETTETVFLRSDRFTTVEDEPSPKCKKCSAEMFPEVEADIYFHFMESK